MSHSIPVSPDLKVCTKCGQAKPLSGFHKMRSEAAALRSTCKACTNAQNRAIYEKNKPTHLEAKRKYRAEQPAARYATMVKYEATHANQRSAYWAVRRAIEAGKMQPPALLRCAHCGGKASVYHHHSYAVEDRLNVTPLCRVCHGKVHRKG